MQRSSGILLPMSALPSKYGIGTAGRAAYDFIDFLAKSGVRWWQMLPIGPTGYGDSPYYSFSAFAGNPYFVDLEKLAQEGLISERELSEIDWGSDPRRIDYGKVYEGRRIALDRAYQNFNNRMKLECFAKKNPWLKSYALYMALKRRFQMRSWQKWNFDCEETMDAQALREELYRNLFVEYEFQKQWNELRAYAGKKGVLLIGDIPIYAPLDSADVFAAPQSFQLTQSGEALFSAGCPPDYFSNDGQLWGNPVYDWDRMKADDYRWWRARMRHMAELFDAIRVDHFRGFENFWAVPHGEKTAKNGKWISGPGLSFVEILKEAAGSAQIIAEDLGYMSEGVIELLNESGLPGMKILEFAFDGEGESEYQPHRYVRNCVAYTGTHDNPPLEAWLRDAPEKTLERARAYLGLNREEGDRKGIIRAVMASVADLAVVQMQDWLGSCERTNTPETATGNWEFRILGEELSDALADEILAMNVRYGRNVCD